MTPKGGEVAEAAAEPCQTHLIPLEASSPLYGEACELFAKQWNNTGLAFRIDEVLAVTNVGQWKMYETEKLRLGSGNYDERIMFHATNVGTQALHAILAHGLDTRRTSQGP